MSAEPWPNYRFGDVVIDPDARSIRRGTIEVQLRQQAFDVLLFLVEHRSRVVSKSELFDAIWEGSAVSEDALVQCIVEIRKAVGDDSRNPWFLRTVPKNGYRLIAEPGGINAASPSIEIESVRTVDIEIVEDDSRLSPRWLVAGIAVLAGLVAAMLYFRPDAPAPARHPPTVAVMFFDSRSGGDVRWLRDGVPDMLISELAKTRGLQIIPRERLFERAQSFLEDGTISRGEACDLAKQMNANRLVTGRFEAAGERIRIDAQILDVSDGSLVAAESLVTSKTGILDEIRTLGASLAEHLGASGTHAETTIPTASFEAYRDYSTGISYAITNHHDEALAMFERAVAKDPGFAMAHARIGYAKAIVWTEAEAGRPYFAQALAHPERLDAKDRLHVEGWDAIARLDYEAAIRTFRTITERYPVEIEAYHRLASLLAGEIRVDEAIRVLETALIIDPFAPQLYNSIGGLYSIRGQHVKAIAAHRRYVELLPREADAEDSLALSYQRAGDLDAALAHYKRAVDLDPQFKPAAVHVGNVLVQMGRYREALEAFEAYLAISPLSGLERARGLASLSGVQLLMGNPARAEALAREAMAADAPFRIPLIRALIETRQLREAGELIAAMDAPPARTDRGKRRNLRADFHIRALYAASIGQHDQAIELATKSMVYAPTYWDIDPREDGLADVLMMAGRVDDALPEYERAVRDNPALATVRFKLGKAYRAAGRDADSRRALEAFTKLWANADPAIPELREAQSMLGRPLTPTTARRENQKT